jgi:carbon monoxide dehydrogenase subunit G
MSMTVTNIVDIATDPDDVWAVLADLPATRWWLPGVVAARVDGDVRICTMTDGQEIHERISELSAGQRSYRFEHLRVPLPVQRSGGTFTVTADGAAGTARVTLQFNFEPLDPAGTEDLAGMIHGAFGQSLESLRRYVEEKVPWDA